MKFDVWKGLTLAVWVLVFVNPFVSFPGWAATTLWTTGAFLVVAHLGEYVFAYQTISKRPESRLVAFLMTFFFGVLYWKDFPSEPWE